LDPNLPATLSREIVLNNLRDKLGYNKCVISDALEMKALSNWSDKQIVKSLVEATVDLWLVCIPEGYKSPVEKCLELKRVARQVLERSANLSYNLQNSRNRILDLNSHIQECQKLASKDYNLTLG